MLYEGTRYLSTTPFVDGNGTLLLTLRRPYTFSLVDAKYHRLSAGETVDSLAYKYYNNSGLAWAITDANPKYMSELDMKTGDIVTIPSFEEVVSLYGRNLV